MLKLTFQLKCSVFATPRLDASGAAQRISRTVRGKCGILSLVEKQLEAVFHSLMHITSCPMWNDLTLIRHGPNSLNSIALALTNDHSVATNSNSYYVWVFFLLCLSVVQFVCVSISVCFHSRIKMAMTIPHTVETDTHLYAD